jgi:iron complex outermembrane receptor protein
MRLFSSASVVALGLGVSLAAMGSASAQESAKPAPKDQPTELGELVLTGSRVRSLEQFTPTGSRLNLSARETPATLDVITAQTMETRGYLSAEEAANSLPGVSSGGAPGDLSNFHIRGFSDTQITVLHNGLYIGPSDMVNRPQNTFNIQSVEILKGPASVLYGQGAIGGAVNMVNKAVSFGKPTLDVTAGGGSFGTTTFGIGGSRKLTDDLAARLDVSRTGTSGFVNNTPGDSINATLTFLWRPTDRVDVQLSVDYLKDNPSAYWGTPLVSAAFATQPLRGVASTTSGYTIDARTRYVNYNVADNEINAYQTWPQLLIKWRPTDNVEIENFFYYFNAGRRWKNAETYSFNPGTNMIDRDRFFVFHQQTLVGDQFSASFNHRLFDRANKLIVGFDYSYLNFARQRGFPDGDSVDPFNPTPGTFGVIAAPGTVVRNSPTYWHDPAIFFEDIFDLTDKLKLVTGARYDVLALDRQNYGPTGAFQAASSFKRTYRPATYRAGLVWDATQYVTPYLSFTTGQDPVGSNIFLVNADQDFKLGKSRQIEAGVKIGAPDNRADLTLALFDIKRDNVLTQTGPSTVANVGSESSKGFEASGDIRLTDHWTVNGNLAYTDAKYDVFVDPNSGLNASGNPLPNTPKVLANAWMSYTQVAGLPLELGGGVRYSGKRSGDNANTLTLDAYTTLNLYATYNITPKVALSVRVDNATDKAYAQAADVYYGSEVILARPRYVQVDLVAHF